MQPSNNNNNDNKVHPLQCCTTVGTQQIAANDGDREHINMTKRTNRSKDTQTRD
jgi:hypothetical protein